MANKPVYAIAVFNDGIQGYVKFSEDLTNNIVKIELNITPRFFTRFSCS